VDDPAEDELTEPAKDERTEPRASAPRARPIRLVHASLGVYMRVAGVYMRVAGVYMRVARRVHASRAARTCVSCGVYMRVLLGVYMRLVRRVRMVVHATFVPIFVHAVVHAVVHAGSAYMLILCTVFGCEHVT
jgi:hypothetical protein